jgi:predicted XRE-type DNA-binding protein
MEERARVTRGSGNVFADLGLPDADDEMIKAKIAILIRKKMQGRKITQTEAAARMKISQPDASKLMNGRVSGFSLQRLIDCLRALGSDVVIEVHESREEYGSLVLEVA